MISCNILTTKIISISYWYGKRDILHVFAPLLYLVMCLCCCCFKLIMSQSFLDCHLWITFLLSNADVNTVMSYFGELEGQGMMAGKFLGFLSLPALSFTLIGFHCCLQQYTFKGHKNVLCVLSFIKGSCSSTYWAEERRKERRTVSPASNTRKDLGGNMIVYSTH